MCKPENNVGLSKGKHLGLWPNAFLGCIVLFISTASLLAQGTFDFNNHGQSGSAFAPVYGLEPADPYLQKWGNTTAANPPGTQVYSGAPLGSNYSAQAWYSLTPVSDGFALNEEASPAQGGPTSFLFDAGIFSGGYDWIPEWSFEVYLQVRVWDNASGQLETWEESWTAAQAGSGRAVGWSKVFQQSLGIPPGWGPGLENFESFNVFIVPEPSTFALFGLGGLAVLLARTRK